MKNFSWYKCWMVIEDTLKCLVYAINLYDALTPKPPYVSLRIQNRTFGNRMHKPNLLKRYQKYSNKYKWQAKEDKHNDYKSYVEDKGDATKLYCQMFFIGVGLHLVNIASVL